MRAQMVEPPALAEIIRLMKGEDSYGRKIAISIIPKLVDDCMYPRHRVHRQMFMGMLTNIWLQLSISDPLPNY
jgi:hypothetical protein